MNGITPRSEYLKALGINTDTPVMLLDPAEVSPLLIERRAFIGTEVEGPLKGLNTLFIQGPMDFKQVEKALERAQLPMYGFGRIDHVYFGAGVLSQFNVQAVQKTIDLVKEVTVESTDFNLIECVGQHRRFNWMLTLMMAGVPTGAQHVLSNALVYLEGNVRDQRIFMKTDTGRHVIVTELGGRKNKADLGDWLIENPTRVNTFETYTEDRDVNLS